MESRGFTVEARSISRGQSGLAGWIHCRGGVVPLLNLCRGAVAAIVGRVVKGLGFVAFRG